MVYQSYLVNNQRFLVNERFIDVRLLGAGAYGIVCSARDTERHKTVAIKKVCHIFDKKLLAKRCLREVKLLQHFNGHQNIINLFDMDLVNSSSFNEIYLVQECMEMSLHHVIHNSTAPLLPDQIKWLLYQICCGLKFIHSAKVLHRDLKPGNILVNGNCDLKICDFGLARGYVDKQAGEQGFMTQYVATRWYRAPEIMLTHECYTKAIDMWSVGCILAEMLNGKVLFKGDDWVDQLHRILAFTGVDSRVLRRIANDTVFEYVMNLRSPDGTPPPSEPVIFSDFFPQCSPECINMMERLLTLDPQARMTIEETLAHPFFLTVRTDPELDEPTHKVNFDFAAFEKVEEIDEIRQLIIEEVRNFKLNMRRQIDISPNANIRPNKRTFSAAEIITPTTSTPPPELLMEPAAKVMRRDSNNSLTNGNGIYTPPETVNNTDSSHTSAFTEEPNELSEDEDKVHFIEEHIQPHSHSHKHIPTGEGVKIDDIRQLISPSAEERVRMEAMFRGAARKIVLMETVLGKFGNIRRKRDELKRLASIASTSSSMSNDI